MAQGTLERTAGIRILVAEDDRELQRLLKRSLERLGYVVTQVFTAADVFHEIAVDPLPDVLVLDFTLPDADGRDLLRRLKGDPRTAPIPTLVWSGRDADSERRIAIELGADDYVEKGALSTLIAAIIEQTLSRISRGTIEET